MGDQDMSIMVAICFTSMNALDLVSNKYLVCIEDIERNTMFVY